jgi:WD40 repeat protein
VNGGRSLSPLARECGKSPDLVSSGSPGKVCGSKKKDLRQRHGLCQQSLISGGRTDGLVKLWDLATHQPLKTIQACEQLLEIIEFSPDGQTLATTGCRPCKEAGVDCGAREGASDLVANPIRALTD